ncbi:hypothetical protein LPMP_090290 [Leishmania panamensis]|uniref:Uncharacterized protein n=1 Tax=Leishmania panamensis TaxID=5679 RepID=A0A088RJF9_LEIPA|nr:hypothetical protein LPMP_090290 [Leishmania panamensis]AIN95945.1 hypothetical protein LPMP_090290 [Leishmania panamensis]
MTFVFEARRMPFGSISETYAARLQPIVALHALDELPLWDRCMLVAVLPVVQQRHAASSAAAPQSTVVSSPTLTVDVGNNADAAAATVVVASLPSARTRTASNEEKLRVSPGLAGAPLLEDVALTLTIVRALDELEAVYDSIISIRAEQQQQQPGSGVPAAAAPRRAFAQPKKTSEEILMEQLLQERFSDTTSYLPDSNSDDGENGAEEVVDVAMCFTIKGESLGIGSANVFGGHGYHP